MPLQMRCGLGIFITVISLFLIIMTLSPGVDVVQCQCKQYDQGTDVHAMCVPFGASLSTIAKHGDDVIMFVYWVLVMAVAISCLRVAGLITFFHSDSANHCFIIDAVVNVTCCVMVLFASAIIVSWAEHDKQCSVVGVSASFWISSIPLLTASAGLYGLLGIVDIITICVPAHVYYVPVFQNNYGDGANLPGTVTETAGSNGNAPPSNCAPPSSVYSIEDENDSVEIDQNNTKLQIEA